MLKTARITGGKRSRVEEYDNLKIKDIVVEMAEWVIENEVYDEPYIALISVEQIIWGKGMHWNEGNCPKRLGLGLKEHLQIHKATQLD